MGQVWEFTLGLQNREGFNDISFTIVINLGMLNNGNIAIKLQWDSKANSCAIINLVRDFDDVKELQSQHKN